MLEIGKTPRSMALAIACLAVSAWPIAAWGGEDAKTDLSALTVSAQGTVTVSPDTAFVTVGMETASRSLVEAQRQNSAVIQKLMEQLRELKIDKERIQTSSFTVTPQYKPQPKRPSDIPPAPPEIIGYVVSNSVTVEVRELDRVAAVITEALAAGANHFHGLQWALRDEQQARLAALKLAAAKAREKAVALSEALHVKLVRLMNVTEGGYVARPAHVAGRMMAAMEGAGGEVPIASGEMRVEATVTLVYEIAQN